MQLKSTRAKPPKGEPFDFWRSPAVIAPNNFKYKSLSNWSFNISVGCSHACRFCYVPSAATIKQGPELKTFGVTDPDEQWGQYSLLRPWDERAFLASLKKADATPQRELKPDGNRAVILCSTTDPYQVFVAGNPRTSPVELRLLMPPKSPPLHSAQFAVPFRQPSFVTPLQLAGTTEASFQFSEPLTANSPNRKAASVMEGWRTLHRHVYR